LARTIVGLAVAIVLIAADLAAQTEQRALLPVKVNEIAQGDVLSVIAGDDVQVPKSFFDGLAIPVAGAALRQTEGDTYVSLRSLAPKITFELNPDDLTLSITVDPHLLGRQVLELKRKSPALDRGGDPSAFFNYALSGQRHGTPSLFSELGATRGDQLLYTGLSRQNGTFTRGLSYANFDSPQGLRRWTVGDDIVGNDPIGGTATIGGVTLSRQFSLQPYFIRAPSVDATGTATTPSTVEVYINGQLVNRIQVGPGVFTLHDLPATGGLGTTQLVIRDAFGRETVQQTGYYYSTALLQKGLSDYTFSAGALRTDLTRSFDYGNAAALAQYRRGVTDTLTLGGRAEASNKLISAGPRLTLGSRLGDFDAEFSASTADGHSGSAAWFAYRFTAIRYSFGVAGTHRSNEYATLSLAPQDDRATRDFNAFVSSSVGPVSLGLTGSLNQMRSGDQFRRLALQVSAPISRWGNLFASLGSVEHLNKTQPEVLVGLTMSVGHFTTANAMFQKSEGTDNVHLELRRPLTQANGYGYSLQSDSATKSQLATLQYQTSFGRYEIDADPKHAGDASYSAAGGLVYLGGSILPSRPVQDSYALARVGVPNVEVFASNQEIGHTNRAGDLLVPNLLPHYANELRINDKDVPMDYEVDGTQVAVVPPSRGGVVAKFPVRRIRSYTGKLRFMIVGEPYTPALGEVDVRRKGAEPETLSLGRSGEFYVEDLDAGTYEATLRIGKVACAFRLALPSTDAAVTDVGVIPCAP
jgi:outer membrane usher protein